MSSENTNNTAAEIAESNKRAALAGQWRTPPLPVFPTSGDPNSANDIPLPPINELPDTTEDYAKALQEAYRRGAEAAAKMASVQQQQQPTSMISTVSCPDFAKTEPPILPPPIPNPLNAAPSASMPPPPPPPTTTSAAPQVSSFSTHPPPPIHQPRSMSMPDMNSYGAAEEEKRQKRLARNRASARLRRLRKKNLVCWLWLVG